MCEFTHVRKESLLVPCACVLIPGQPTNTGCAVEFAHEDTRYVIGNRLYKGPVCDNGHVIFDPGHTYYNLKEVTDLQSEADRCKQHIKRQSNAGIFRFVGLQKPRVETADPFLDFVKLLFQLPPQTQTQTHNNYVNCIHDHARLAIADLAERFVNDFTGSIEESMSKHCKVAIADNRFVIPFEFAMVELYTPMNKWKTFQKPRDRCGNRFHSCCFSMFRGSAHVCRGLMPRLLLALYVRRLKHMAYLAALSCTVIRQSFTRVPRRPTMLPAEIYNNIVEFSDLIYDQLDLKSLLGPKHHTQQAKVVSNLFTDPGTHKIIMPCIVQILQSSVLSGRHLKFHDRMTVGTYLGSIYSKAQLPHVIKLLAHFFTANGIDDSDKTAWEIGTHANTTNLTFIPCSKRFTCPYKSLGDNCVDVCARQSGRTLPPKASASNKMWSPETVARIQISYQ